MRKSIFLLMFLCINNVFASSRMDYYKLRANYESFKSKMTDEFIVKSILMRKKDKSNESVLRACIAAYVCSDDEVRGMLEEELGSSDMVIKTAKEILVKTTK